MGKRGRPCLEPLPILWSDLVRVPPGRPAALPTATGEAVGKPPMTRIPMDYQWAIL